MKLHINIAEDAELRAFIKEQIRGAVQSITREEILAVIVQEIGGKTKGTLEPKLGNILASEIRSLVHNKLSGTDWYPGLLDKIAREEVKAGLEKAFQKVGVK